jgi:hypothetical protein
MGECPPQLLTPFGLSSFNLRMISESLSRGLRTGVIEVRFVDKETGKLYFSGSHTKVSVRKSKL